MQPFGTEVHLSGGDITGVVAGPGLTGGGAAGLVTLGLVPSKRVAFDEVVVEESTSSFSPTGLATAGPSVTIQVPDGGLGAVYARVEMMAVDGMGAGALRVVRDDHEVPLWIGRLCHRDVPEPSALGHAGEIGRIWLAVTGQGG